MASSVATSVRLVLFGVLMTVGAGAWAADPATTTKYTVILVAEVAERGADLVLVDGDPAGDISAIRQVETVVKDGVVYDAAAVYDALGIQP